MNKGYCSRKEKNRKIRKRIYIICEGEKTEHNYFNGFKERNSGVEIIPIGGQYTDPKNIVEFAEKRIDKWSIDFEYGDAVWCVFDVDRNSDHVLKEANDYAISKNINVGLSNPCFELWFLLHFKDVFSSITCEEVIHDLKRHIKNYKKSMSINDILKPYLSDALKRAIKLNKKYDKDGISLISTESNRILIHFFYNKIDFL